MDVFYAILVDVIMTTITSGWLKLEDIIRKIQILL
jgi:hypothetical protein